MSGIGGPESSVEPDELPFSGQVIAFKGQKIYCLNGGVINRVDVPQQRSIQTMDQGDLQVGAGSGLSGSYGSQLEAARHARPSSKCLGRG